MNSSQRLPVRTRLFARVIGPFLVIVPVAAALHPSDIRTIASLFAANLLWCWVVGAFVLLIGLVVVALHQNWRGGPAIFISAVGWLVALKGLFLLVLPRVYTWLVNTAIDSGSWWQAGLIVVGSIGVYLTYVGWIAAPSGSATHAATEKPHLPHAA